MNLICECIVYILAGFFQEFMVVIYQRASSCNRKLLASVMTTLITMVSLLVMARITHQIMASGPLSLLLATVFAIGKGIGAYITLGWWRHYGEKTQ